jgi:hypothetical protein
LRSRKRLPRTKIRQSAYSMIRKSVQRFSEKIMLNQSPKAR